MKKKKTRNTNSQILAGETGVPQRRRYSTGDAEADRDIQKLIIKGGGSPDADLLQEMIMTGYKMAQDGLGRGDLKLLNTSLKELRYAFKVFHPYRHVRKVAIFGSARTPRKASAYLQTKEFSRRIVERGWMVITGASTGIMSAGNEGAGRANSFGVNIRLPFEQFANPIIANDPKLINFKYFFTRKLIFIAESDATVLFPGGFGTHDEGFETLTLIQTGKTAPRPVVCIDPEKSNYWKSWREFIKNHLAKEGMIDDDDIHLIHFTHDPKEAVEVVTRFYKNYHSLRYIGELLVMRIKKPLTVPQIEELNEKFGDIVKKGKIRQHLKPFDEEDNEPHTADLTRICFYFNRRHFARLVRLIHLINGM